jgi:hypothetical protein
MADVLNLIAAAAREFQPLQNVCGLISSTINPENLALPLPNRELPAGPLISSLQLPEKAQVQGL